MKYGILHPVHHCTAWSRAGGRLCCIRIRQVPYNPPVSVAGFFVVGRPGKDRW